MSYSTNGFEPSDVYYTTQNDRLIFIGHHPTLGDAVNAIKRYQEARRQAAEMGCRIQITQDCQR